MKPIYLVIMSYGNPTVDVIREAYESKAHAEVARKRDEEAYMRPHIIKPVWLILEGK
jgi:hypothetical protein